MGFDALPKNSARKENGWLLKCKPEACSGEVDLKIWSLGENLFSHWIWTGYAYNFPWILFKWEKNKLMLVLPLVKSALQSA